MRVAPFVFTLVLPLLPVAAARPQPPEAKPGAAAGAVATPILGSWFTTIHNPDGSVLDLYDTFSGEHSWNATAVFRDKAGKVLTRRAWGEFSLTASAEGSYRLVTSTDEWSPRHTCVDKRPCESVPPLTRPYDIISFIDLDHFHAAGDTSVVSTRLRQLPIEATTPVPHILMLTATGEPSDAPTPVGLDSMPQPPHPRWSRGCDNLQQQRICTINDGQMGLDSNGCKVCYSK